MEMHIDIMDCRKAEYSPVSLSGQGLTVLAQRPQRSHSNEDSTAAVTTGRNKSSQVLDVRVFLGTLETGF